VRTHPAASYRILVATLVVALVPLPAAAALDGRTRDALLKLEAVLDMPELSQDLWPSWDISETPFILVTPDSTAYLINHPHPPPAFSRVREESDLRTPIYEAGPPTVPAGDVAVLEDMPVAVIRSWGPGDDMVALSFEAAFRAHGRQLCGDSMEPIELLSGYPVDAWNLVLANIECRLLHSAATAPDDSLDTRVKEFASIRRHRRLRMGGRYAEFERRIEFAEGIPIYIAERCRNEAEPYLGGRYGRRLEESLGEAGALSRCFPESPGLDWYRGERFRWTGAVLCQVMDRYLPSWKNAARSECVGPFEILSRRVRPTLPPAGAILDRFGYEQLVAGMTTSIEESKSDAEKQFESVVRAGGQTFSVATHLLASGEVRFDPTQVHDVDAHRSVNTGLLSIEYSGGTHVYITGIPVAVVLGDDEYDFRSLIIRAPEEYSIVLDGAEFEMKPGVYEFANSLVVKAPGFSLEAMSGTVMVGERGVSFILYR
jgi:hypothetical protein